MTKSKKQMAFHKVVIGCLVCASVAMGLTALRYPPDAETRSPHATFSIPESSFETASGAAAMVRMAKRDGFTPITVNSLSRTFSELDYDLDRLREGEGVVPGVFVASMPADMPAIRLVEKRKTIFFKTVLPLVLRVNEEIAADRRRLDRIRGLVREGRRMPAADRLWVAAMAERYEVSRHDLDSLARRMDVIPPSLALAQAAEESGWGTSRFVLEGNALFGQWTFARSGHLVPEGRDEDKSHRVRAFSNLIDAVRAYVMNLNTHRAYRKFRDRRRALREAEEPVSGLALVPTLTNYSERGAKYTGAIREIITVNKLQPLDDARLGEEMVELVPQPAI